MDGDAMPSPIPMSILVTNNNGSDTDAATGVRAENKHHTHTAMARIVSPPKRSASLHGSGDEEGRMATYHPPRIGVRMYLKWCQG